MPGVYLVSQGESTARALIPGGQPVSAPEQRDQQALRRKQPGQRAAG